MADYTTLAYVKALLKISSTDATDDGVIDAFIDAASAYIEGKTNKVFVAPALASIRYFDVPEGRDLYTGWFTSIAESGVVNGNSDVIPSTEYQTVPLNSTGKHTIRLKQSSGYAWESDGEGNTEGVIAVNAYWAYSATVPADIREACEIIVVSLYKNRYGQNTEGAATITGAGVVITPKDIPASAQLLIDRYKTIL